MEIGKGKPHPLGLSVEKGGIHVAVLSHHATAVFLGLFSEDGSRLEKEILLHKTGSVWHGAIQGLKTEGLTYAVRCEGPRDPKKGLLYNSEAWLVDPYAKRLQGLNRARVEVAGEFDWQGVRAPRIPLDQLIIYEMHVRGFTKHGSSGATHPGTYLGMIDKIPYLKELGVNAVELMPLFEFDETRCIGKNLQTGQPLVNYWGYHPLHFFCPTHKYAVSDPIHEFKTLVRALHQNGIEVLLDVVYNHTGEEQDANYYVNFRGLDNSLYYLIDEQGNYRNYCCCGNSFNCNQPEVKELILSSLRYWVQEMHVDGFRFDSAAFFFRDSSGTPQPTSSLVSAIAKDPLLKTVKCIAEPWDAGGLSLVGTFSKWGYSEWNGHYRDAVRRFIKGTDQQVRAFAHALSGSEEVYRTAKTPQRSINYITAHDGFSLRDLVSYAQKHNEANGEGNKDGVDHNDSWNCGVEGASADPAIVALRERQMRNFLLALFISQGVPMLLMGDEYGHTRSGNNNPYAQDNEINWFLWDELEKRKEMFTYTKALIQFRKDHPALRRTRFLTKKDIEWHGVLPHKPDWSDPSRFIAFSTKEKDPFYVAFNASPNPLKVTLPPHVQWRELINTFKGWSEQTSILPSVIELPSYTAILCQK